MNFSVFKKPFAFYGIIFILIVIYLPSYTKIQDLKQKNNDYKKRLQELVAKNEELKAEKERLIEDPTYLEKVAREKMGLGRKGEVILRITPEDNKK